jgi:asparagine synthase (glutamine-hydrolysing)
MSAICGIYHLDGQPAARETIAAMSAALAHRGPDREGLWSRGELALGHRLLITTPESAAEAQPLVRSQPDLALVADARIDNRDDLLSVLRVQGGRGATDSDIILAAYERWGQRCVDHLVGDFAFVLWDARAGSLFCARDPMGVKPLYYFRNDRLFAFASEPKSLFTLSPVTPAVDPDEVALFMGWRHEGRTRTLYRDVMRLPAAHTMVVSRDRALVHRYWDPESAPGVHYRTDDDYADAFRDIFGKAVEARSRSALPVGATLSGGLDSSSVVCMARRLRKPLHTFSVIFPNLDDRELRLIDERSFVDAVVRGGGVRPHLVRGDEITPLRDVRKIVWHLDEPYFAPNLYLHWAMYGAARNAGVRVLLDGFDGDSAVSHGFGRLTGLARAKRWDTLEAELLAFGAHHRGKASALALQHYVLPHLDELVRRGHLLSWLNAARNVGRRFGLSRSGLALTRGIRPLLPFSLGRSAAADPDEVEATLQPSLAASLRRRVRALQRTGGRPALPTEREAHVEGLSQPLYQLTLETADKAAAAFGIEPRYPFFDRRLIELCVGLPDDQKFGGGWPRLLLRRALDGILPPEIQWRSTKSSLAPNFHRQFRIADVMLYDTVDETALAPYLRIDRLRALRGRLASDESSAKDLTLFRSIALATWLKQLEERSHRACSEAGALSTEAA